MKSLFVGGEPTIHPKFREIIEDALAKTKSVSIVTNGACVSTEKKAVEFFEFLREHPELTVFFLQTPNMKKESRIFQKD